MLQICMHIFIENRVAVKVVLHDYVILISFLIIDYIYIEGICMR